MNQEKDRISKELMDLKLNRKAAIQSSPLFDRQLKFNHSELKLIFGQYWHLLTYFPDFLAKMIPILPSLEYKGSVARVLSEELGNGDTQQAHETAYFEALALLGFSEKEIKSSPMLEPTRAMMQQYRACEHDLSQALGYFVSTEFADLWIVSSLGRLMRNALPKGTTVRWIDLHVTQEPGHVTDASNCVSYVMSSHNFDLIMGHANQCGSLWDDFFKGMYQEIARKRQEQTVQLEINAAAV